MANKNRLPEVKLPTAAPTLDPRSKRRGWPYYTLWGIAIIWFIAFPGFYSYEHIVLAGYQLVQYPAAIKGDADAQYEMGQTYRIYTTFLRPDRKEAFRWELRAAEQGHVLAMVSVGNSYHLGKGVELDLYAATDWYRKAAEQGDPDGEEWLLLAEERLHEAEEYRRNGDYDRAYRITGRR